MGTKKGRAYRASLEPKRQVALARGWSLEQIPQPRKALKGPINRHFDSYAWSRRIASPNRARFSFSSQGEVFGAISWQAKPKLRSSEGWRPGLDLNQDIERCTALASTLSATGPIGSSPISPRGATRTRY
jgi:hypothetical protein